MRCSSWSSTRTPTAAARRRVCWSASGRCDTRPIRMSRRVLGSSSGRSVVAASSSSAKSGLPSHRAVERIEHVVVGRGAGDGLDLVGQLAPVERGQVDAHRGAGAEQLGQHGPQRMAAVQLVAAHGGQQHDRPVEVALEEDQQVERRAIGPVQVLDDEEHRGRRGQVLEQPEQQLEQPARRHRLGVVSRLVGRQAGHQRAQLGDRGAEQLDQLVVADLVAQPAQRLDHRSQGHAVLAQLDAPAEEHDEPTGLGVRRHHRQQPGLADAGLPGHDHHRSLTPHGAGQRVVERRQLRPSTDETGAGDAAVHVLMMPTGRDPVTSNHDRTVHGRAISGGADHAERCTSRPIRKRAPSSLGDSHRR